MILLPVWLCTICSIRGSLFSISCPQELHLSLFDLCVLFIWWASDTWMVVVFGHIRHLCSSFMYIIIVFVHYLFKCTRLTLSMCVLFNLVLSSDFFHYRQNMEMFPRHEHFFWCMSFVHFPLVFKGEFIITVRTLELLLVIFFMWSSRTFIFNTEKLHFLQFLTKALAIISSRTLLMATGWTRSLAIERSWFFVTISAFKLDISLFMAAICALSSSVFFSFLLIHYGCLFCLNKLMKFTYDMIFYVAFGTFRWVSLFTGVHCVICVFKNEKTILSVISMFLTYVSSTSFASPPTSRSSAISTICH